MDSTELTAHQLDRDDGVAWIRLDRPSAQHSLTAEMAAELRDISAWAATDESVRTIVLGGTGGLFCTGADLRTFEGSPADERKLWNIARRLHAAINQLVRAPKPVITAVEGVAAGGGLGLALCGDLVYLADDTRLEFAYPRIGLSGDGGSSYLLPRLIGLRRARELALLDEPIDAIEAVDLGLATDVVSGDTLDEEVTTVARELANGPTRAYGRFKQLTWDGFGRSFEDQLRAEVEVISRLARTHDYSSGFAAFTGDDHPEFIGE